MRYKVTLAYDGRGYAGFQSQINAVTIQDIVEDRLSTIFQQQIKIVMSSRTDAGVHAKAQVFHFDSDKKMDPYRLKGSLNRLFPKDIFVKKIEYVSEDFHCRFSAHTKTYEYLINLGEYDVFLNGYAYQCFYPLDIGLMEKTAQLFLGTHDFGSFNTSSYDEHPDQTRTITEFRFIKRGKLLKIRITGTGFLRNMVRIMVGTLVDLGRGLKTQEEVIEMLKKPDKSTRRNNIDPNGLYLVKIHYE